MMFVDDIDNANFCITVYDSRSKRVVDEFYFKLDKKVPYDPAYALKYVCKNYPEYVDWKNNFGFFKVKRGYKVGVC